MSKRRVTKKTATAVTHAAAAPAQLIEPGSTRVDLDSDITMDMLSTLVDDSKPVVTKPTISVEEMIAYIMTHVNELDHAGKFALGNILVESNLQAKLKESADGVMFVMDDLPQHVLSSMYVYMTFRLQASLG